MKLIRFCTVDGTRWETEIEDDQSPDSLFMSGVWAWPNGYPITFQSPRWLIRGSAIAWIEVPRAED